VEDGGAAGAGVGEEVGVGRALGAGLELLGYVGAKRLGSGEAAGEAEAVDRAPAVGLESRAFPVWTAGAP
jgi:hypothetical protein